MGLLTIAGKSPQILISATQDLGKVFACMHDVKIDGSANIIAGIQKAQLALKHRQNLVQRQRIVVFVSSPVKEDEDSLVKLAKKLKKNSVAVDIVHVGDDTDGDNIRKLDAFHAAINSGENSRILHVPAGSGVLADVLMGSDIYAERDQGGGGGSAAADGAAAGGGEGGAAAGGTNFEFGVDPAVDPELAMVLRISMEEERARQEAANRDGGGDAADTPAAASGGGDASAGANAPATAYDDDEDLYGTGDAAAAGGDGMEIDEGDEDAMLQQAIAMSQAGGAEEAAAAGGAGEGADDEDEELKRAIEMSKQDFDEDAKEGDGK